MNTPTFTASQTPKPARQLTAGEVAASMRAARTADVFISPIHYFTVIVPYVEPARASEWHPDHAGERLSRGAFGTIDDAHGWAKKNLGLAPYGITEIGFDGERGDWSRVVVPVPSDECAASPVLKEAT